MNKFNDLLTGNTPVIVDFYADWCAPCKMMGPILHEVKDSLGDKIKIIKVDVDKNPEVAEKYGIRSIPTLMLFKDGELKWNQAGVVQSNQLINLASNYF